MECPICVEISELISPPVGYCDHKSCMNCWILSGERNSLCPFCRCDLTEWMQSLKIKINSKKRFDDDEMLMDSSESFNVVSFSTHYDMFFSTHHQRLMSLPPLIVLPLDRFRPEYLWYPPTMGIFNADFDIDIDEVFPRLGRMPRIFDGDEQFSTVRNTPPHLDIYSQDARTAHI